MAVLSVFPACLGAILAELSKDCFQCRHGLPVSLQVAEHLENAVSSALDQGYRTGDLYSDGTKKVGCKEMGDVLLKALQQNLPAP